MKPSFSWSVSLFPLYLSVSSLAVFSSSSFISLFFLCSVLFHFSVCLFLFFLSDLCLYVFFFLPVCLFFFFLSFVFRAILSELYRVIVQAVCLSSKYPRSSHHLSVFSRCFLSNREMPRRELRWGAQECDTGMWWLRHICKHVVLPCSSVWDLGRVQLKDNGSFRSVFH